MSHDDARGKRCPDCGEPMTNPPSLRVRQCATGCKTIYAWELKPGQAPLVGNNRIDRKEQAL